MNNLDIIICVHSTDDFHDKLLSRALHSLCNQSYKEFGVIIVKDSCWENTQSVIDSFKPFLNIRDFDHVKQGLAAAKNFGIEQSKAEWIAYLDADDAYNDEKLMRQVVTAKNFPELDIIGTQAFDVYNVMGHDERKQDNCFSLGQYMTDAQIKARLPHENVMCHGSIMLRRRVLDDLGHYSTSSHCLGREDYCLWLAAARKGYMFYNIPMRLYNYSMNTSVPR